MPPKRKHKTTKAPPTTPQAKTQSARTSATKRKSSVAGQGAGARTSRLQPSEPLHMTTRGAAKAASNHTSPAASSVANSNSRRSSLNDVAQFRDGQFHVEDERPAKRSRVSTDSGSTPDSTGSIADQIPVIKAQTPEESKPMSHAASNASKTSSKKRRASGDSSESSKTVSARANGIPTRSESAVSDKQPRRKKRKTTETEPEPADPPPELTDASTAPGSPEQMPEIQSTQSLQNVLPTANVDAPAKATRRLPGRRRQPHPDVNIEADLRRQLNIKMSYRSLAKIQKNLLEELSNRTTNNLEKDPEYYKQCPEYPGLMAGLANHRQQRLDQVHAERRLKLEQLERLRKAEEHIQNQQYINRFEDLRDDFLLQCYHRMKQIERGQKGQDGDATDDEQNVIEPTRVDLPTDGVDDRLGPRFVSRSRAYIETERMLDKELLRQDFQQQQRSFMEDNEDLDDSAQTLPDSFATFNGPDRAEAIAHYNVSRLVDAASEIEKNPPQPEPPMVIPNEQADALFLLASLSAEVPPEPFVKIEQQEQQVLPPQVPPPQVATPAPQIAPNRAVSPLEPLSSTSAAMSLETPQSSPVNPVQTWDGNDQNTPRQENNGNATIRAVEPEVTKNEPEVTKNIPEVTKNEPPVKVSSHRIMDILNDDMDVPLSKSRESQPRVREKTPSHSPLYRQPVEQSQSSSQNGPYQREEIPSPGPLYRQPTEQSQTSQNGPYQRENIPSPGPLYRQPAEQSQPSQNGPYQRETVTPNQGHSDNDQSMPDPEEDIAPPRMGSSPPREQYWSSRNVGGPRDYASDHTLPKPNPIGRIREMLDRTARNEGNLPPLGYRHLPSDDRQDGLNARRDSNDRSDMAAPPLSRAFSPQERSNNADRDSRRPSVGGYNASSSNGPQSYDQSPRTSQAYLPPVRQNSQDQGSPYWDQGRRLSGSQAPSTTQYGGSPAQSYPPDYNRSGPTPPTHQSPYPPPNSQQLPSISQALPPKPPGPPPAAPINFRFAHYDPAPPRPTYPPTPAKYAPASHPTHSDPHRPSPHHPSTHHGPHHLGSHRPGLHYPNPRYPNSHQPGPSHSGPPPPPQYSGSHNGGSSYQGYVPPPGSFQAPPPPPPQSVPQYPPLKIRQYGGQPILPANMAPPQSHSQAQPPHSQPPPSHSHSQSRPPHSRSLPPHPQPPHPQPPHSQAPPPPSHSQPPMNYMSQSAPASSYSPPAPMSRNPQFEHISNMPRDGPPERPPEPQPRPRRQYRAYHAPGTQFRTYQGPDTSGRRRGT